MGKIPFIIEDLSIHKMPGLPKGLKPYKNFSPNINIIAGPNASGKSSTARAIKQIIWRNDAARITATSKAKINAENWHIQIDSNHVAVQKNGVDTPLTGLPAEEAKDRYMLALHELVRIEEKDLAQQIIQESLGGYNLEHARQELQYNDNIPNKQIAEYKNVHKAKEDYKTALKEQKELKDKENSLEQLESNLEEARKAAKLKEFYEAVKKWIEQKQKFEQAEEEYNSYSPVMEKVNGEELKNIEGYEKEIEEAKKNLEHAQQEIEKLHQELQELTIPDTGIEDRVLKVLQEKAKQLENAEREIDRKKQEIARAEKEEQAALQNIGESLDYQNWKGITLKDVTKLDEFLDKATKAHSEKQFLETEIHNLQGEAEQETSKDADTLKQGVKSLSTWLREVSFRGVEKKWIWIISLLGLATAVAVLIWGIYGLAGLAVMLFVVLHAANAQSTSESELRKQDYLRTGLESPEDWNIESVAEKIDELSKQIANARYNDRIVQKREQRKEALEQLQKKLKEVEEQQEFLKEKLKAVPDLPNEDLKHFSGLYYFLTYVKDWQEKHTELEGLQEEKKALEGKYSGLMEEINQLFTQHNEERISDATWAYQTLEKIKGQESTRKSNTNEIEKQQKIIEKETKRLQEKQSELKEIYSKLGLREGEKDEVKKLVGNLGKYNEVRQSYYEEQRILNESKKELESHSLFSELKNELPNVTADIANERIEKYKQEADKQEGISNQIATIKNELEKAKRQNDLENALKEYENARSELDEKYKSNLSSQTGYLILDQLRQQAREHSQNSIFKRANELFNKITKGRYELRIEGDTSPVFRAYDTVIAQGQPLENLSTGTRIQLLLSVRLAFIEQQESALKLPVLADELLANSDDVRAKAIIDALVEISKEGRQVFYFTAQADEVAKWEASLKDTKDIDCNVYEIKGENDTAYNMKDYKPSFSSIQLTNTNIPSPGMKTHKEYGKELQVPPFNLLTEPVNKMHLWYLLEDTGLLYNCLVNGISRWGQLKSFFRNNGVLESFDKDSFKKLSEKAAVLEEFQELYRKGRSKPVDRSILEQSGAVSDKFIDAVHQKLEEADYNPEALIAILKNKDTKVPRFQSDKIEELEEYLQAKGYLSNEKPLDKESILVNIQAYISNLNVNKEETERMIERVLTGGPGHDND